MIEWKTLLECKKANMFTPEMKSKCDKWVRPRSDRIEMECDHASDKKEEEEKQK